MRRPRLGGAAVPWAVALVGAAALAHVRLVGSGGTPLRWGSPTNVSIVVQEAGSDDVPDASDDVALRMAIESWNQVDGTRAQLVEDTSPVSRARTDWEANDLHMIVFDELNASGYFGGSGIVAITPVWFLPDGKIQDADVLFNGDDFTFTTSGQVGAFDVEDVAAHELGHLLGLDHSGWAGATMYPYVDPSISLHRSLSEDEVHGLRHMYPQGGFGTISGKVVRSADGTTPVEGAHVVARDDAGRTRAAILSAANGTFTLRGLDPGTYEVYVAPLDDPVGEFNLANYDIESDFEPAVLGTPAVVTGTANTGVGTIEVGPDVALNLGTLADLLPQRVVIGSTTGVVLHGTGLNPGAILEASDPLVTLSAVSWFGTQVTFLATVPAGVAPGHVDLSVTDLSGALTILPAALELTRADPVVTGVSPASGSTAGSTPITITGTGFVAGSRVVVGDRFYADGTTAHVTSPTTITLTTAPTVAGVHDVVVIGPSGEEGRLADAFQASAIPAVAAVFPTAGDSAGGTLVRLTGANFQPGVEVRLNGVVQTAVTLVDDTTLEFVALGGTPGPQLVEVENTDSGLASAAYTYFPQADPALAGVSPAAGKKAGGDTIVLTGTAFPTDAQVVFGADPDTGLGGTPAASVAFVDGATLEVVTPAGSQAGAVSVLVRDASSGQASLLPGAFTFRSSSSGGGGGCHVRSVGVPLPPSRGLAELWWAGAIALGLLVLRARAAAPARR